MLSQELHFYARVCPGHPKAELEGEGEGLES